MRSAKLRRTEAPRPITPAELEKAALDYLERFASSAQNLKRVLLRRLRRAKASPGDPAYQEAIGWIEGLLARFRASGLLDDRAYAETQAISLSRRGLARRRIAERLAAKGVGRDEIRTALDALQDEHCDVDLAAAVALARRRGLGPFRAKRERGERRQKDISVMARAGFGYEVARRVIDATDAGAIEAEARKPDKP